VRFGPFPFLAIAHRSDLSPRREFTITSAGFWAQEATNEWLLTRRPSLRSRRAPVAKGASLADSIRVDERAIGAIVLAPALLDAYRYFKPEARWAKWGSRAAKAGSVLLVIRKR
jgi:hypothetical protein